MSEVRSTDKAGVVKKSVIMHEDQKAMIFWSRQLMKCNCLEKRCNSRYCIMNEEKSNTQNNVVEQHYRLD